jgi:hypothetical protein
MHFRRVLRFSREEIGNLIGSFLQEISFDLETMKKTVNSHLQRIIASRDVTCSCCCQRNTLFFHILFGLAKVTLKPKSGKKMPHSRSQIQIQSFFEH